MNRLPRNAVPSPRRVTCSGVLPSLVWSPAFTTSGVLSCRKLALQPPLAAGDVGRCGRAGELGVSGHDRVVDPAVLVARLVQSAVGLAAVPEASAQGARGQAGKQGGQD